MFALCLDSYHITDVEFQALADRLDTYGVKEVIRVDKTDSLAFLGPKSDSDVLLISAYDNAMNALIRRLTLSTSRLPSQVAVWSDAAEDRLVAARLPWDLVRQSWLNDTSGDHTTVVREVSRIYALASFTVANFTSGETTRIGGSFAKSGVQRYFQKQASGRGAVKLADEMNFYRSLPLDLCDHYPELLFFNQTNDAVSFGIDYKDIPNLRDLLLNCDVSPAEAASTLRLVLQFEYGRAYLGHLMPTPPDYLENYHFHRVWRRM
ncbi:hypothetical protein VKT23_008574 [Stygiomarasmius scandens]|uniref:Uncharacterized protein n=1 Tax=Marasmiellus scandens TaxID=2682957 RepID=A0ABR1JM46_9AGAR